MLFDQLSFFCLDVWYYAFSSMCSLHNRYLINWKFGQLKFHQLVIWSTIIYLSWCLVLWLFINMLFAQLLLHQFEVCSNTILTACYLVHCHLTNLLFWSISVSSTFCLTSYHFVNLMFDRQKFHQLPVLSTTFQHFTTK